MRKPLPQGWAWATLNDIARWGSGGTPKKSEPCYYGGDIPWTVIGDLNDSVVTSCRDSITPLGLRESSCKLVEVGTVLIAMYGSIGKLGIAGTSMTTNQAIAFAKPLIDRWFLFYYLSSQRPVLAGAGKGATQKNISQAVIKPWPIPIPPLTEQKRIVERIEEIFARLDAVETRLKSLLEKLNHLRSAILADALHTNRHTLPRGWVEVALSDVAQIILGQSPPGTSYNSTGDGVAFFQGKAEFGKLYPVAVKWTTKPKRLAKQNDILLSVRAPVGPTNLAPVDCAIGRGLHAIRPNTDIDHLFLLWALRASVGLLRDKSTGSTFNAVTGQQVKTHRISIPPLVEQTRLVKSIETQFSHLDTTVASINYGLKLVATLRQSVLAEAFTGRLVPQDPDDEPASELLKRIAASRPTKPKRRRKARA